MKITKRQLIKIIREEAHSYGKDYLSKTHHGGKGELADPRLDYDEDDDQEFVYATDPKAAETAKNVAAARNAYKPAMRPTSEGKLRMKKSELHRLIEATRLALNEDNIDTELDHLKKNISNDLDHIKDLKDDLEDDHDEELRAEKAKRDEDKKKDESVNRILRRAMKRLHSLSK